MSVSIDPSVAEYRVMRCFETGKSVPSMVGREGETLEELRARATTVLYSCDWVEIERRPVPRPWRKIFRIDQGAEKLTGECTCSGRLGLHPNCSRVNTDCPLHGHLAHLKSEHTGYWTVEGCTCQSCDIHRACARQLAEDMSVRDDYP